MIHLGHLFQFNTVVIAHKLSSPEKRCWEALRTRQSPINSMNAPCVSPIWKMQAFLFVFAHKLFRNEHEELFITSYNPLHHTYVLANFVLNIMVVLQISKNASSDLWCRTRRHNQALRGVCHLARTMERGLRRRTCSLRYFQYWSGFVVQIMIWFTVIGWSGARKTNQDRCA